MGIECIRSSMVVPSTDTVERGGGRRLLTTDRPFFCIFSLKCEYRYLPGTGTTDGIGILLLASPRITEHRLTREYAFVCRKKHSDAWRCKTLLGAKTKPPRASKKWYVQFQQNIESSGSFGINDYSLHFGRNAFMASLCVVVGVEVIRRRTLGRGSVVLRVEIWRRSRQCRV